MSQIETIQSQKLTSAVSLKTAFPAVEIESLLRDRLSSAVTSESTVLGISLPDKKEDLYQIPFDLDSYAVLETLSVIEPYIGDSKVLSKIVRAGGYESIDKAIEDVMPKIKKQWDKRNGGKK